MKNLYDQWLENIRNWRKENPGVKTVPDFEKPEEACFEERITKKLKNIDKIEYVGVGDNPGNEEYGTQKYFCGKNTKYIRDFFKKLCGENYEEKVLFLNKSFVSTSNTKKLQKDKSSQEIMADFIAQICNKNHKIKLWILGDKDFKKFSYFKERLLKKIENTDNIYAFEHPSNRWFCFDFLGSILKSCPNDQFKKLTEDFEKQNPLDK